MIEAALDAVLLASVAYLGGRTALQVYRQHLSYTRIPFADPGFSIDPEFDREVGTLLGIAVGDALGGPRESLPPSLCALRYGRQPSLSRGAVRFMRRRGTITDDTQHTWLVARAITASGFDDRVFADSLDDWMSWRIGPGRGTEAAIRAKQRGEPVSALSEGNGAAMRVAPLVLAFRRRPDALRDAVERSAAVTHPAPAAIEGAQLVAELTLACLTDSAMPAHPWLEGARPSRTAGWVVDTVASAHSLFVKHQRDWRAALAELYELGGDTDTVGAILCSFVGAKYGASVFGDELVSAIQGTGVLAQEAVRLATLATAERLRP